MLLEFDDSWILLKDTPSVREMNLIKEGRAIEALPSLILEWSIDEPITFKTCMRLKAGIVSRIINVVLESVNYILKQDELELKLILKSLMRGINVPEVDKKILELYNTTLYLVDHRGNVANFPNSGGYLDQPFDMMYFLRIFRQAFSEWQNENQPKGR